MASALHRRRQTGAGGKLDRHLIGEAFGRAPCDHERAKTELKGLMPEDAKEAMGHGIRAKRSRSGAISFDLVEMEDRHASVQ